MSNETSLHSSEAGETTAPIYTTTFVVDLGEHPGYLRHRSRFSGRGIVEVSESGLIVRYSQWRSPVLVSLLLWFSFHLVVTIALSSLFRRFVCSVSVFDPLVLILIGIAVIISAGRRLVDIHLDSSLCTAYYVHEGGFVVVETPGDEWINMTPMPANETRFLADVRKCFGDRFVTDSQVVSSMGMEQLVSAPRSYRSAIFGYIREVLAVQTDRREEAITVNSLLAAGPKGTEFDMSALLVALKAEYNVDLTQADQEGLITVADVVGVVCRKLAPASPPPLPGVGL